MLDNIDEVFAPIFFYYPNGLRDRTLAEPRNPTQYITQWRDIAAWRQIADAGATQYATERLTKQQMQSILHEYIYNFIQNEANDTQRKQSWTKNKSRAEAVLCRRCGTEDGIFERSVAFTTKNHNSCSRSTRAPEVLYIQHFTGFSKREFSDVIHN